MDGGSGGGCHFMCVLCCCGNWNQDIEGWPVNTWVGGVVWFGRVSEMCVSIS